MLSTKLKWIFVAVLTAATISCTDSDDKEESVDNGLFEVSVPKKIANYSADCQFIRVEVAAGKKWTITVDCGDVETSWAEVDVTSGTGRKSGIIFSWESNAGGLSDRSCDIILKSVAETGAEEDDDENGDDDKISIVTFTQTNTIREVIEKPIELTNEEDTGWIELPEIDEADGYYFITHRFHGGSLDGFRNYSIYFDPEARLSMWVAYPLNKGLMGSGSRKDAWGLDPKVPRENQAIIYSGFRSMSNASYDRGHQLPSADRYTANASTFYFTNMTPQRSRLNQQGWATLEGRVRTWANSVDTLYVVTGCDFRHPVEYAKDNEGANIPVPSAYFKALVAYKRGSTLGTQSGYAGIAFWYEHEDCPKNHNVFDKAITIDELEERLGYDFFVNLPGKIGQANADLVESTIASWWKTNPAADDK